MSVEKSIEEIQKNQAESAKRSAMINAREIALSKAPIDKISKEGVKEPTSASEIIDEAEIIYKWLIKDL